ncbi:MAG: hypothetical protein COV66_13265 [Nitrospinae bacterium CG11_big_fil_rev_8_21_14_0_20_45_15]|nr:MAG: hypothetical protein COV66_13265 [Nitrospinae bacterium CG11_big_fil_rev_8_21_14_0_20_45_15]
MKKKFPRKNSFRKRIWVGAAVFLFCLIAEGATTLILSVKTREFLDPIRVDHVSQTNELKVRAQLLKDALEEYAITGEDFALEELDKNKKAFFTLFNRLQETSKENNNTYENIQRLIELYFNSGRDLGKAISQAQPIDPQLAQTVQDTYNQLAVKIDDEIAREHAHLLKVFHEANINFERSVNISFFLTVLITIVGMIYVPFLIRKITRPIIQLEEATQSLSSGDLDFKVDITSNDEFQDLGNSFNFMVKSLREKTAHLEDAKVDLKNAMEAAESANRAKSTFLASMSHEIRTPMNAILGYSQILMRDQNLTPKEQKAVHAIQRGGEHLLSLINEILDISKIEAGKMELKCGDFDLSVLMEDLSSMFSFRCEQRNLTWSAVGLKEGEPSLVFGDEGKLRQVLINLLGNALKFTETGGISIKMESLGNHRYLFEVKDTGIGIDSSAYKTIFEPFHQAEAGFKKGGTGLGLAISQKQVHLMGGNLIMESELGKGSRFYFTIDLAKGKEQVLLNDQKWQCVTRLAPGFNVKALVVEDDPVNRQILETFLSDVGVSVRYAEDGYKAIESIREEIPDIIFMDYQMPGMDGLQTMRKLYQEFGKGRFKVVIVSASAFQHEVDLSFQEGCHEFIPKPIHVERVYETLGKLLNVEFEYRDEVKNQPEDITSEVNFLLPADVYLKLKEAAQFGQMTELEEILTELESKFPESSALANHLRGHIERFDMEGLLHALDGIAHG